MGFPWDVDSVDWFAEQCDDVAVTVRRAERGGEGEGGGVALRRGWGWTRVGKRWRFPEGHGTDMCMDLRRRRRTFIKNVDNNTNYDCAFSNIYKIIGIDPEGVLLPSAFRLSSLVSFIGNRCKSPRVAYFCRLQG